MNRQTLTMEHLGRFEMRDYEQMNLPTKNLEAIVSNYVADALIDKNGDIMAIVGFYIMWEGVADVFAIPSKNVNAKVSYVLHVRRELDRIMIEYNLRRLQTFSLDDDQTNRWMEILGFKKEGTLEKFSSKGDDYNVWARLSDG